MNILIINASGRTGSAIVKELSGSESNLILTSGSSGSIGELDAIQWASKPSMESEDPDVNIRLDSEPDSSLTIADPVRPDAFIINMFKIYVIIDYN